MPKTPLVEVGGAVRLDAARTQHPVLALVPVLRGAVDPVPGELVRDEERRERREQIEPLVQRIDVVEHATRDDGVPRALELLERRLYEALALRRIRVDAEHVVPGCSEQLDEPALSPAADLEDALRRWRQLVEYEGAEVRHDRQP